MLQLAQGDATRSSTSVPDEGPAIRGHAVEVRVYAEDPRKDYQPSAGLLTEVVYPDDPAVRVDAWAETGQQVTSHYDPMLAKVIVHAADRTGGVRGVGAARSRAPGSPGCRRTCRCCARRSRLPDVLAAAHTTGTLAGVTDDEPYIDVVRPGRDDDRAGLARAARATGTSASRRRGRWTTCRSGWATARWATPRARPGSSAR